jgi:hypothetical protein
MIFKLRNATAGGICGHSHADGPFVDSSRLILLEKCRGNEWLENKPTAEIDTKIFIRSCGERIASIVQNGCVPIELILTPRPGGIQGWRPRVWICIIVEGIIRVRDP